MSDVTNRWCDLPTPMGTFRMYDTGDEHVRLLSYGDVNDLGHEPLLRIHSSCLASEVFGATDCDCADQLREAMKRIATEGRGLLLHLHQEGRGQGLSNKIQAVHLMQRDGLDTAEAFDALGLEQDTRGYDSVVYVLRKLGVSDVRLISNNPRKGDFLRLHGVTVTSIHTHPNVRPENADYLRSKNAKLGHTLPLETEEDSSTAPVHFYHSDQPWGELSNFSRHAVFLREKMWPTVEHFYQAQKFAESRRREEIRLCATPMLAKCRAGEHSAVQRRADWLTAKETTMLEGLRAKFTQHPDLQARILASGVRYLAEHTKNDLYWGDGADGSGQNRLGHLLMQVRDELRSSLAKRHNAG